MAREPLAFVASACEPWAYVPRLTSLQRIVWLASLRHSLLRLASHGRTSPGFRYFGISFGVRRFGLRAVGIRSPSTAGKLTHRSPADAISPRTRGRRTPLTRKANPCPRTNSRRPCPTPSGVASPRAPVSRRGPRAARSPGRGHLLGRLRRLRSRRLL